VNVFAKSMSTVTIEVEFDHGRVIPRCGVALPAQGTGTLTFVREGVASQRPKMTITEFVAEWGGSLREFTQEEREADPRLDYLLKKHAR
jgi:hypothetical protein